MASFNCNGICHRHPNYSPIKLKGSSFRSKIDGICRKCEAYFIQMKEIRCPCCKQKLSRSVRKGRAYKNRIFRAFADFWKRILNEVTTTAPHNNKKKDPLKTRHRRCYLCNSDKTFIRKKENVAIWSRYKDGFICSNCYNARKRKERQEAKAIRIKEKILLTAIVASL